MNYPAQIVVNVLYKDFPELAVEVDQKIREKLPVRKFDDFEIVGDIIDAFCQFEQISREQLYNAQMIKSNTNSRRILIAALLKIYQPEIICGLLKGFLNSKVSKALIQSLGISRVTISYDVKRAIRFYQMYSDFRDEVDIFYNLMLERYGSEKNNQTGT